MANFLGLQTALSGIRAGQTSLDTASNNVANAGSEGYTRQRVSLSERTSLPLPFGPMGTGASVDGIARVRDGFLDTRVRATAATFRHEDTRADLLQRTEELLGEPDAGLSGALDDIWDAFEDLANDPSDAAARQQALAAIDMVTGRFRSIDEGLGQLADDTSVRLDGAVTDANELLVQLDRLNREVTSAGEAPPNDLLDRRDVVVDQLSELAGVEVEEVDGAIHVLLGSERLVGTPDDPVALDLDEHDVGSGEIAALSGFLTEDLPAWREGLDGIAEALAGALNDAHAEGGGDELVEIGDPGAAAATIRLAMTDPDELVAGEDGDQDGSNAERIAALRDGDVPESLRALITGLGRETADATRAADAAESLHTSATTARQSAHGVSVDEEMVSLVQHQRALEAASRVMTSVDQALDVLINRTGIVGR